MENIKYICELIIKNNSQIYFDDEEHFENFLKSPEEICYCKYNTLTKYNILFYLTHKKYNLMKRVIDYGLFDKININKFINISVCREINILMYASAYSNNVSTTKIVKTLLKHPDIDVNLQDENGYTALIHAMNDLNYLSSEETVIILLNHPDINVNLEDDANWDALSISIYNHLCSENIEEIWKLFEKHNIKHNMFYLHEKGKEENIIEYNDGLRKYMKHQRFNLINHRRYYRKYVLNKGY